MNTTSPHLDWLVRKWNLPAAGPEASAVMQLLAAEHAGSTACALDPQRSYNWGNAAADHRGTEHRPLVVVPGGRGSFLQSRHLSEVEQAIAKRLCALAQPENSMAVSVNMSAEWAAASGLSNQQLAAVRHACEHRLTILTGGPGTGKTFTLARILALFVESGVPDGAIRLAAPTGKAADRMKQAISDSIETLPDSCHAHRPALQGIADASTTLHRLLGYHPDSGKCRYHHGRPLRCDVLIVDESSMVDLLLWHALFDALPETARVILIGDPNQLESIGQGNVFTGIARIAGDPSSRLGGSLIHLSEARRFKDRPGILAFANALETGNADAAVRVLEACDPDGGLAWTPMASGSLTVEDGFPASVLEALSEVAFAKSPGDALDAMQHICILTAQRQYFVGALAVSELLEIFFRSQGHEPVNRPVIINRNDPETGLRNGSIGVVHTDADGQRLAWFRNVRGDLKAYSLASLPEFSPAWAITIHRSQGSEYREVLVILPREDSPLATRELLYTAITRAKSQVTVAGDLDAVRKAVSTRSDRVTLLADYLTLAKKHV
jgi:exodeoxyribonuclease V alpha subunit